MGLLSKGLGIGLVTLYIYGLLRGRKDKESQNLFFRLWFFIPLLLFSVMEKWDDALKFGFLIPIFPAVIFFLCAAIEKIGSLKTVKEAIISSIMLLLILGGFSSVTYLVLQSKYDLDTRFIPKLGTQDFKNSFFHKNFFPELIMTVPIQIMVDPARIVKGLKQIKSELESQKYVINYDPKYAVLTKDGKIRKEEELIIYNVSLFYNFDDINEYKLKNYNVNIIDASKIDNLDQNKILNLSFKNEPIRRQKINLFEDDIDFYILRIFDFNERSVIGISLGPFHSSQDDTKSYKEDSFYILAPKNYFIVYINKEGAANWTCFEISESKTVLFKNRHYFIHQWDAMRFYKSLLERSNELHFLYNPETKMIEDRVIG